MTKSPNKPDAANPAIVLQPASFSIVGVLCGGLCAGHGTFFFVITPLEMLHVPIRAFQDDNHIQKFIQTAQAYVKIQAAEQHKSN
jgi:hypothetical protein